MKQGPINKAMNTSSRRYNWLHLLCRPNSSFSDMRRLFIVFIMLNIALVASFFLKNVPISDKFFVLLCLGIGVEYFIVRYLKDTHFPRYTETSMSFSLPLSTFSH